MKKAVPFERITKMQVMIEGPSRLRPFCMTAPYDYHIGVCAGFGHQWRLVQVRRTAERSVQRKERLCRSVRMPVKT
ncbi:hypothetical protein EV130_102259 [Rhizobium azibense]|uniref:Uncharacterized protein n=1 Tax=Rhizobium azibense TaxID=1136135 RepID=A0A4R3R5I6_9HYPH|nr:hypothetical protein EV130_102259 [Rhizobium azibense]TCU37720.1 hypothetical protein EV129_10536 [Rhizobium azibense]